MHRIVLHDCHRRCRTISICKLVRAATGMSLREGKDIIDELYYGSGTSAFDLPASVDAESLAAELRACGTEVEVIPVPAA